jgi:hypothetical protein
MAVFPGLCLLLDGRTGRVDDAAVDVAVEAEAEAEAEAAWRKWGTSSNPTKSKLGTC